MEKVDKLIEEIKINNGLMSSESNNDETFRLRNSLKLRQGKFSNSLTYDLPLDLIEWWTKVEKATLFEDIDYGQWGLELLDEKESIEIAVQAKLQNSFDYLGADLIIGKFLGDLDLVIISLDNKNFGQIIISTPIDHREDWYFLEIDFLNFLTEYLKKEGEKFWEYFN